MTNQEKMQKEREILTKNLAFQMIGNRLGNLNKPHKPIENLEGINDLSKQLNYHGGYFQQNRMIKDKQKSLAKALLYSYQGAFVKKCFPKGKGEDIRVLINPNRVTQDYDDKILSVGFEADFKLGDVIEWVGTDTYWLIYLQQTTELAYFRGNIRKCSYQISWLDGDKKKNTYAAIKGPTQTSIESKNAHGMILDTPNYSLTILLPKNEDTLKKFKRYSKFYLSNIEEDQPICWRVEAVDSISSTGILEITAKEYYSNEMTDDLENKIVDGLIEPIKNPNADNETAEDIIGPTFIKPRTEVLYEFDGAVYGDWGVKNNLQQVKLNKVFDEETGFEDKHKIKVTWLSSYSGQFDLTFGDSVKTIVVESLF